jgi:hypothetical protein
MIGRPFGRGSDIAAELSVRECVPLFALLPGTPTIGD